MILKYYFGAYCSYLGAESSAVFPVQCPGQGSHRCGHLLLPREGQEDSPPGRWRASGALLRPHCLVAFVTLLCFPLCALEPLLRFGSRLEGCCCSGKRLSWPCCGSAFEEQRAEPEPCPISKHRADRESLSSSALLSLCLSALQLRS